MWSLFATALLLTAISPNAFSQDLSCITVVDENSGTLVSAENFAQTHGRLQLAGSTTDSDGNPSAQFIVDENGDRLTLRGISTSGLQHHPECYPREALEVLVREWGVTALRIAFYPDENGYAENEDLYQNLEDIVDIATELGIYVIIDWHIFFFEGADLIPASADPNTWLDRSDHSNVTLFFETVARQFGGNGNIIYEICNGPRVSWERIKEYADVVIPAIRAIDSDGLIIVGTPEGSSQLADVVNDQVSNPTNVLYSFQYSTGRGEAPLDDVLSEFATQIPIFVSSYAISGTDLTMAKELVNVAESNGISHVMFSYVDKQENSNALRANSCADLEFDATACAGTFLKNTVKKLMLGQTDTPTSFPTTSPFIITPAPVFDTDGAPTDSQDTTNQESGSSLLDDLGVGAIEIAAAGAIFVFLVCICVALYKIWNSDGEEGFRQDPARFSVFMTDRPLTKFGSFLTPRQMQQERFGAQGQGTMFGKNRSRRPKSPQINNMKSKYGPSTGVVGSERSRYTEQAEPAVIPSASRPGSRQKTQSQHSRGSARPRSRGTRSQFDSKRELVRDVANPRMGPQGRPIRSRKYSSGNSRSRGPERPISRRSGMVAVPGEKKHRSPVRGSTYSQRSNASYAKFVSTTSAVNSEQSKSLMNKYPTRGKRPSYTLKSPREEPVEF